MLSFVLQLLFLVDDPLRHWRKCQKQYYIVLKSFTCFGYIMLLSVLKFPLFMPVLSITIARHYRECLLGFPRLLSFCRENGRIGSEFSVDACSVWKLSLPNGNLSYKKAEVNKTIKREMCRHKNFIEDHVRNKSVQMRKQGSTVSIIFRHFACMSLPAILRYRATNFKCQ